MKIYFDGTEVNSDIIVYLKQDYSLFGDSFKLGSTPSNMFELSIYGTIATPSVVTIYINNTLYATVKVEKTEVDNGKTTFKLSDSMVNLEFYYNARPLIEDSPTGYVTTMDILLDICDKANLTLENDSFVNDDVIVGIYDNTVTARQYVSYIAELNGGYAIINESGNLELLQFDNTSVKTLDIDTCSEDMTIKDHHLIGRVAYDNGLVSYAKGTGETCYIQTDNPYIASQEVLDNIYDVIAGFEFYAFSTTYCPIDASVKIGQKIDFEQGLDTYPTIAQCVFVYNGDWIGGYNLDILSSEQSETNKIGRSEEYKRLVIKQNLTDAELQIISEKQVELTKIVTCQGQIALDNAYEGQLYKLSISGQMSLLYPMSSAITTSGIRPYGAEILYPSSNLYLKSFNLMVDNVEYPLNCGFLNYMDSTTYDEIQYESGTYKVIRRVGIDSQGEMYALDNEVIESTNELNIQVKPDSVIKMKSFNNAILSCVYLLNNYNTAAELTVTTDSVMQQVVKNDEVVAKINLAIEEGQGVIDIKGNQVKIQSDNFILDQYGNMEANSGTFKGTLNTGQDCIVGDNLYVGQNQEQDYTYSKYIYLSDGSYLRRYIIGDTEAFYLSSNDVIRMNQPNNSGYIQIAYGNISMSSQPSYGSDIRLKDKIQDVNVDWIDDLKVKEYEYKQIPDKKNIGLIAQDYLEEDFSKYFLSQNPDGFYSISYGNITNGLIKYCQELKKEVEDLKQRIEVLERNEK